MNVLSAWPVVKINPVNDQNNPSVRTNMIHFKDRYEIKFAVPGFTKEELAINIQDHRLTIEGKVSNGSHARQTVDVKFNRREFSLSDFHRSFRLGEDIDRNKIDARHENGILTIVLPKVEKFHREIAVS